METARPDRFAKIFVKLIAPTRELHVEHQDWPAIRADLIIHPGPHLPPWTGILADLLQGLVVLEPFYGRPRDKEVAHGHAKGLLAAVRDWSVTKPAVGIAASRLIMLGIGYPGKVFLRVFGDKDSEKVERGCYRWTSGVERIYFDLLRFRLDTHTLMLHIIGNSPRMEEAFGLLSRSKREEVTALVNQLIAEVGIMDTTLNSGSSSFDPAARSFLKAWERSQAQREGKLEGKLEGQRAGVRNSIMVLLSSRFGQNAECVKEQLNKLEVPVLYEVLIEASSATSLAQVQERLRQLPTESPK